MKLYNVLIFINVFQFYRERGGGYIFLTMKLPPDNILDVLCSFFSGVFRIIGSSKLTDGELSILLVFDSTGVDAPDVSWLGVGVDTLLCSPVATMILGWKLMVGVEDVGKDAGEYAGLRPIMR